MPPSESRLFLEINVGERLSAVIADDEAGVGLLSGPPEANDNSGNHQLAPLAAGVEQETKPIRPNSTLYRSRLRTGRA